MGFQANQYFFHWKRSMLRNFPDFLDREIPNSVFYTELTLRHCNISKCRKSLKCRHFEMPKMSTFWNEALCFVLDISKESISVWLKMSKDCSYQPDFPPPLSTIGHLKFSSHFGIKTNIMISNRKATAFSKELHTFCKHVPNQRVFWATSLDFVGRRIRMGVAHVSFFLSPMYSCFSCVMLLTWSSNLAWGEFGFFFWVSSSLLPTTQNPFVFPHYIFFLHDLTMLISLASFRTGRSDLLPKAGYETRQANSLV